VSSVSREFEHGGGALRVSLRALGAGRYAVSVGEARHEVEAFPLADGRVRLRWQGEVLDAACAPSGRVLQVRLRGRTWSLHPAQSQRAGVEGGRGSVVEAPMTGTILKVLVAVGDRVARGQTLAVLAAMKMEHKLAAGVDGVVAELRAAEGATVEQGDVLAKIDAAAQGQEAEPDLATPS
jgi:biotin carboxyl carrier protein